MIDNLESALRLAVMRLARRMRLERGAHDLRDHQLSVLFVLMREGPISIGTLGEIERVSRPSMTRTVDAMAKAGYLRRSIGPDDGRQVVVDITPDGRRAATDIRRRREEWFSDALLNLNEDERRTLLEATALLQRLADS